MGHLSRLFKPVIAVAFVIAACVAGVAGGQSGTGAPAASAPPADVYRAFIADYAAGRPVCSYLSEDARASELGPIVDSALDLFDTSAPPLLESADAACETIRANQRPAVLRMGELRPDTVTERSLSATLAVLTVDDHRVLMERNVRTGAWLVVSDIARAIFNSVAERLDSQEAGSESSARLQDALAALSTEATRARRRYGTLLARRGADAAPVAGCRGRARTVTGPGPLRSATLRIAPTSLCLTVRARDALPLPGSATTLAATVILSPRTGNPLRIEVARLAGGHVLLQADGTAGARQPPAFSVLVKPARWAFGSAGSVLRFRIDLLPHQARKLRRPVRWIAALDRLEPGRDIVSGTQPGVEPGTDVVPLRVRRKLAIHPGSR